MPLSSKAPPYSPNRHDPHEGDNIGESRLIALVTGAEADADHASVYGCGMDH